MKKKTKYMLLLSTVILLGIGFLSGFISIEPATEEDYAADDNYRTLTEIDFFFTIFTLLSLVGLLCFMHFDPFKIFIEGEKNEMVG